MNSELYIEKKSKRLNIFVLYLHVLEPMRFSELTSFRINEIILHFSHFSGKLCCVTYCTVIGAEVPTVQYNGTSLSSSYVLIIHRGVFYFKMSTYE